MENIKNWLKNLVGYCDDEESQLESSYKSKRHNKPEKDKNDSKRQRN